jgi:predicted alpha/beta superfamily hydrolase
MKRSPHRLVGLLTLAALASGAEPACSADGSVDLRYLQGLGEVRYHRLESRLLGRGFHLFVRLPESYSERDAGDFPTAYLLDGGLTFPLLGAYYRYLELAGEVPEMIVVGISYGRDDYGQGNHRGTDFTAPSAEREHYGGAARFQEVLRTELLPLIERRYRSDPERRLIFGQSLGGQFVLFTALTDPGLFWGHIASNPALHRNLELFLEDHAVAGEKETTARPPRVFVSSAELDEPRFREPALRWMSHWTGRERARWQLRAVTLDGHGHFSAAPEAFRRGLRWIFEQ